MPHQDECKEEVTLYGHSHHHHTNQHASPHDHCEHEEYVRECHDGPMGPQGNTGCEGPAGEPGEPGPRGCPGTACEEAGPVGPCGPCGPQGCCGREGPLGPRGAQGKNGIEGPKGDSGCKGPRGERGPTGCKGEKGCKGDVGCHGPQGDQGCHGPQGCEGPRGHRGRNCDEPGPPGPRGERGCEGPAGEKGCHGDTGCAGPQGPAGTCACSSTHGACAEVVGIYEGYFDVVTPGAPDVRTRSIITILPGGNAFIASSRQDTAGAPVQAVATTHCLWEIHHNYLYLNAISMGQSATAPGQMRKTTLKVKMDGNALAEIGTGNVSGTGCQKIFTYADASDEVLTPFPVESTLTTYILYQHTVSCGAPTCAAYP